MSSFFRNPFKPSVTTYADPRSVSETPPKYRIGRRRRYKILPQSSLSVSSASTSGSSSDDESQISDALDALLSPKMVQPRGTKDAIDLTAKLREYAPTGRVEIQFYPAGFECHLNVGDSKLARDLFEQIRISIMRLGTLRTNHSICRGVIEISATDSSHFAAVKDIINGSLAKLISKTHGSHSKSSLRAAGESVVGTPASRWYDLVSGKEGEVLSLG